MMDNTQLCAIVNEITGLPNETEWIEFKLNKAIPDEIGEYISALSNSCALHGKPCAYILWGVEDGTRRILGTSFHPHETKIGNEALENWLAHHLTPRIDVRILRRSSKLPHSCSCKMTHGLRSCFV
jgi:predicted HTH transcriptional regulator